MAEGRMKRRGSGAKSSTSLFGGKKSAELEEFSKKAKEITKLAPLQEKRKLQSVRQRWARLLLILKKEKQQRLKHPVLVVDVQARSLKNL